MMTEAEDLHLEETLLAACAVRRDMPAIAEAVTERLFFVREQIERAPVPVPPGPCLLASGPAMVPTWVLPGDKGQWQVGRDGSCELVLSDSRVSRHHAEIRQAAEDWQLVDLHSQNGVRVNGSVVTSAVLRSGDVIEIADYAIIFMA